MASLQQEVKLEQLSVQLTSVTSLGPDGSMHGGRRLREEQKNLMQTRVVSWRGRRVRQPIGEKNWCGETTSTARLSTPEVTFVAVT